MNTSSWGPHGWRYLHTVAQSADRINMREIREFFYSLKDVLPCKWCRLSYQGFEKELPIARTKNIPHWLYQIHNMVNSKLRNQGLLHVRDPSFPSVESKYKNILTRQGLADMEDMWYFLATIAHNWDPGLHSRNDYVKFFELVGQTMPYSIIKPAYESFLKMMPISDFLDSQENLTKWLYSLKAYIYNYLESRGISPPKLLSYPAFHKKFEAIRANCATKQKVGTCQIPNSRTRCPAITQRGRQCIKRKVLGKRYCSVHLQ